MQDNLEVNTKLGSYEGIIGRRDYFLNLIILSSIALFYTLPYSIWLMTKITQFSDIVSLNTIFYTAPMFIKVWYILGTAGVSYLLVSNIVRRLNDINGRVNLPLNIICSLVFVINSFGAMFPRLLIYLVAFASFILGLILIFKKGKITSQLPYDVTKEFNWGAFLGTWIWGLFNKSYIPLFYLLLFLTPWAVYFQLYCGLKGNEWAYKNKKWDDVSKFNKSQEKQTLFWSIFNLLILPIIYLVFIISVSLIAAFVVTKSGNEEVVLTKLERFVDSMASTYFENYTLEENENKFYVLSSNWESYSYSEKKDILDFAAKMAHKERPKNSLSTMPKEYSKYMRDEELPRTKIYSANNLQLLAEFQFDESLLQKENPKFSDYFKVNINGYKFYNIED